MLYKGTYFWDYAEYFLKMYRWCSDFVSLMGQWWIENAFTIGHAFDLLSDYLSSRTVQLLGTVRLLK